jgi:tetratricopeptide (TPR) repeat protein
MVLLADVPPLLGPGSRLPGRGITRRLLAWKRVPVTGFLFAVLGASTLFSSACSLRPLRSKEALLASGLRAEKAGKLAEAIILYKQALQSDARFGEAHGRLARLELEIGSVEAARFHLLRAVELQPSNFDAHVRLAGLNYQIYFADSARPPLLLLEMENVANQLVQGWPQRPQGYSHQSTVLLERHRGAEAAALIRGAMSRLGSEPSLQTQLASIEHSLGHKEEAIALLRELVARGSNHSPAYDLLYLQLMEANRNNEAGQCLREKWRNVGDLDSGLQLAAHYYASGGNELVRRQLDEALKKLGGSVETQARVGDFWLHRGEPERARAGYEAGLEAHPSSRELYIGRFVELSLAQQDRRSAISLLENELRLGARSDLLLAYRSALDLDQAGKAELSRIRAQLEAIVSRVPRSAFVRYHLGRAYLRAGDVVRGEQQLEKCLRLDPNYAPGWMALADTEFKRGNHGRAERRVDQMLAHAPRNVPALLMKARLQASRGSLAAADATLEQVSGRGVPDTLVRLERASLRLLSDDPQGSIRLLEPALRATPGDDRVIVALALAEAAAGNHNQALERLDRAVAEHPDSLRVLAARASAGLQSGDPVRAAADYRRLKEKSPEQVEFSIGLADALALAGKLSDAAAEYRRAQLIEPSNPRAWLNLAAVLIAAGDRTAAKDAYARALGLDANNPFILNNYSYLLARGGENLSYALQLAQQADRLMPGSREIGDTLVYVHTRLGMHQQAITQLDQLLTRTPQGARKTLENLRAGLHRGDVKGSLRLMEQARDQHAEAQLRGAS